MKCLVITDSRKSAPATETWRAFFTAIREVGAGTLPHREAIVSAEHSSDSWQQLPEVWLLVTRIPQFMGTDTSLGKFEPHQCFTTLDHTLWWPRRLADEIRGRFPTLGSARCA